MRPRRSVRWRTSPLIPLYVCYRADPRHEGDYVQGAHMEGESCLTRNDHLAPVTNQLLERLSAKDRASVLARCEEVDLSFGEVLAAPGEAVRNVYFPTGCVISLLVPMGGKSTLEVATVGSEGIYGGSVALGIGASPLLALVQGA